ncbi:hypothetical protein L950_0230670 [Sphingobacterium sp. IITKGP-BTPF85]|nr:hypothetical protein L950_0230670 [Sphingobacterium sp. IITKGP-BTPF85]
MKIKITKKHLMLTILLKTTESRMGQTIFVSTVTNRMKRLINMDFSEGLKNQSHLLQNGFGLLVFKGR